jgi:hypothetical protein
MTAQFNNPLYNLPPSSHERSFLPLEHPDYEANKACPPKLLFPSAHRKRHRHYSPEITREDGLDAPPKKPSKRDKMRKLEAENTEQELLLEAKMML